MKKKRQKKINSKAISKAILTLGTFLILSGFLWVTDYLTTPTLPKADEPPILLSNQVRTDLTQSLVGAIKEAKKSVLLIVYTLTDSKIINALNEKAISGAKVKVIVDGRASPFVDRKLSSNIQVLKRFGDGLMHLKILVIDESHVYVGSANMTSDSLRMHGNLVLAVVNPALASYLQDKANLIKEEGSGTRLPHSSFLNGDQKIECWFLPDNKDAIYRLLNLIQGAEKTIQVAMFTWTRKDLANALIQAKDRGVKVEIVLDHYAARGAGASIVKLFEKAKQEVRLSQGTPLLHHKFMLIDGKTLVNGSANWTKAAFTQNDDCFMVLNNLTENQQETMKSLWHVIRHESLPAD